MQRKPTLTNSGLRAVQRIAGRGEYMNIAFAAIPEIGLSELLAPNLTFTPIPRDQHCGVEFEDYCTQ